jgi:hypothetical protein
MSGGQPPLPATLCDLRDGRHGNILMLDLTSSTPSTSDATQEASPSSSGRPTKSSKRKAAEALLDRKASSRLDALEGCSLPSTRSAVEVRPCGGGCPSAAAGAHAGPPHPAHADVGWCSMRLSIPPLEWPAILQDIAAQQGRAHPAPADLPLPGGLTVRVVESAAQVGPALEALRASMADCVVGIDLEWRPDYRPGSNNRVALIQLASASACVLVRCCRMGFALPPALLRFFADPALTFVSFSWDSCDEAKMAATFGAGRACFARFADLQRVAQGLGYAHLGLARLTQRVLGVTPPKSRTVARSDWERGALTPGQVQYAALDALLTGHVFRGLRLWHASPSACPACRQMLGVVSAGSCRSGRARGCSVDGDECLSRLSATARRADYS